MADGAPAAETAALDSPPLVLEKAMQSLAMKLEVGAQGEKMWAGIHEDTLVGFVLCFEALVRLKSAHHLEQQVIGCGQYLQSERLLPALAQSKTSFPPSIRLAADSNFFHLGTI